MSTGTGSLKELREKRKLERAASEHGNSNKISPDRTGIHSGHGAQSGTLGNLQQGIQEDGLLKVDIFGPPEDKASGPYADVPPITKPRGIDDFMESPSRAGSRRRTTGLIAPSAIPIWDEEAQRWRQRGRFYKPPTEQSPPPKTTGSSRWDY